MKKLVFLTLVAFGMVGCGAAIEIPAGTSVRYENYFTKAKVVVSNPLADVIITKLSDEPDSALKSAAMGLDTRKYLYVGARTFQVNVDELVLLDDWGVRTWRIKGIEAQLEALISKSPDNPDAGDA